MELISYTKFRDAFAKANEENRKMFGVVVYSQKNWKKEYPLDSRSYATYSDQWGWADSKMGHCKMAYALDGSDFIRMDYYPDWKIDYCYFITEEEFNQVTRSYI